MASTMDESERVGKQVDALAEHLAALAEPTATDRIVEVTVYGFDHVARTGAAGAAMEDFLWSAFNALFQLVGRTPPENQKYLVEFVAQLRTKAVPRRDEWPSSLKGEVYTDLPTFGWVARDLFNYNAHNPSIPEDAQTRLINITAFLAQLTARAASPPNNKSPPTADKPAHDDPLDFSLFALWALRDAFEQRCPDGSVSPFALRLAAVWLRFAGDRIEKLCSQGYNYPGRQGAPGPSKVDRADWKGFCGERLAAWKEEWKAVRDEFEGDERYGDVVGEMVKMLQW
ncbi:hypothetical protein VTI74DRAFT_1884 [Chaetomium olivicolor]